jgi:predicted DCC family thiol-disulfide oxidoreductase YuxK
MEEVNVYFDGQCGFCRASSAKLLQLDRSHRLKMLDYNDPEVAATAEPRFRTEDLAREMHVRMPDGTWRIGFAAWAAVLSVLPATAWLGWLMKCPLVSEPGRVFYRWFASRRLQISRLLGLPAPCGPNGACRIDRNMK